MMPPFFLLSSLQIIANFFGAMGLVVGGLLTYGGVKIYKLTPKGWAGTVLSGMVLVPGILVLFYTAFLVLGAE
ncbi:hypothetical protein [Hymenobacter convexus]|uniref:hypothetical protein n=1 Tax=Hymenobacter sp. CA1UV-4 TaxID=3063782 RepID=UPI0027131B00|nr:hypothetical protein [Hymenobacter sp. CA1UV-4]MDO7854150.1 hypothetical protein [Hymenobacter sp. CA1UV-4]